MSAQATSSKPTDTEDWWRSIEPDQIVQELVAKEPGKRRRLKEFERIMSLIGDEDAIKLTRGRFTQVGSRMRDELLGVTE